MWLARLEPETEKDGRVTSKKPNNNDKSQQLKGQCHEISDPFYWSKNSTRAPNDQAKKVFRTYSLELKYRGRKSRDTVPLYPLSCNLQEGNIVRFWGKNFFKQSRQVLKGNYRMTK